MADEILRTFTVPQYPGVIKHGHGKSHGNVQRVDDFRKVAQIKYDPMFTRSFKYMGDQTWDAHLDINPTISDSQIRLANIGPGKK